MPAVFFVERKPNLSELDSIVLCDYTSNAAVLWHENIEPYTLKVHNAGSNLGAGVIYFQHGCI